MKVEVNVKEMNDKMDYPCLMISDFGKIVFFTKECTGTVVNNTDFCRIGDFSDGWNMRVFKPFHGTITLSNE